MVDDVTGRTDWATLSHAFGPATDTPGHLRALLSDDVTARDDAVDHLFGSVLHQGTIYPATAPAALAVASYLPDERTAATGADGLPTRGLLLGFLGEVGSSLADVPDDLSPDCPPELEDAVRRLTAGEFEDGIDEEAYAVVLARSAGSARAAAPDLLAAALPWLEADQADVRRLAVYAVTRLAAVVPDPDTRARVTGLLRTVADDPAAGTDQRAEAVLGLEALGEDVAAYLRDRAPEVRVVAASSESCAADPEALAVVLTVLEALPDSDDWLPDSMLLGGTLRFRLAAAAVARCATIEELMPAGARVLEYATSSVTVDEDWGPVVALAFPTPPTPRERLSEAQRDVLRALVVNNALWGASHLTTPTERLLTGLGLPPDRRRLHRAVRRGRL
jgi:hypothetical protein